MPLQAFGEPAFPVDTHVHRLALRWGLSKSPDVKRVEAQLKARRTREAVPHSR
jgi:endonuclease III